MTSAASPVQLARAIAAGHEQTLSVEDRQRVTSCVIVMLNGRYFRGFDRRGHVLTAWSLAGARHFLPITDHELRKVEGRLVGERYTVRQVHLQGDH